MRLAIPGSGRSYEKRFVVTLEIVEHMRRHDRFTRIARIELRVEAVHRRRLRNLCLRIQRELAPMVAREVCRMCVMPCPNRVAGDWETQIAGDRQACESHGFMTGMPIRFKGR